MKNMLIVFKNGDYLYLEDIKETIAFGNYIKIQSAKEKTTTFNPEDVLFHEIYTQETTDETK